MSGVPMPIDPRSTRAWRALRDRVVREEPTCTLRLPGCTHATTTADHIVPVIDRPDLAMVRTNLRGSCTACNLARGRGTNEPKRFEL